MPMPLFPRVVRLALLACLLALMAGCGHRGAVREDPEALDLPRFMGTWHVIAHVPYFAERGNLAPYVEYSRRADGLIDDKYTAWESFERPPFTKDGMIEITNPITQSEGRITFLPPRGYTSVITSTTGTTPQQMEQYDVALLLHVEGTIHYLTQALPVIGMRPLPAVDVLIGRDVLALHANLRRKTWRVSAHYVRLNLRCQPSKLQSPARKWPPSSFENLPPRVARGGSRRPGIPRLARRSRMRSDRCR